MSSSSKPPTLPPPTTPQVRKSSPELSSPELGSPSKITQYNKQTGRPIRKSAGKVKRVAGYVDIEDEDFGPLTSDDESDDADEAEDEMESRGRADKKKKRELKRKRSPSPPSPHLAPIIYNQELDELTDNEDGGAFHRRTPKKPPITLQFNVPLGFHGPLFVKLDSALLQKNEQGVPHEMQPGKMKKARTASPGLTQTVVQARHKGFTDLPPELRNTVYRYLFARKDEDEELKIPAVKGSCSLQMSAQFLRTCKLVHNEACSILYGENTFSLSRHYFTRGPFWEPVPKEIGYQDVLQYLKMIGPENLQYLREVKFTFDDALPRDTPYLYSHEQRRYLNDEYLMNCLRILRDAKIRKFHLHFQGRRQLYKSDVKFLGYLEQIKADEVVRMPDRWIQEPKKIRDPLWNDLQEVMVRKKRLYTKE
ncbi:hypothetical protein EJ02DRAFT_454170 [Clathrospora elynae]|uniref:Uncharacterized protein n=1 Tax=Clathrospora elynae TaxID=706981 RepID=A0A6A5SQW3_9PLEO|nr:hypothetical protein EJ02DRAFT_454170 [Clathrospora elynae]